jgi:2-polyprenyl-3-methyl-5-hydroxy-6-metoxy-1,4-benzoquinol methylase
MEPLDGASTAPVSYDVKGSLELTGDKRQLGNQLWWTDNTMSYDWNERSEFARFSPEWYEDIDQRWLQSVRLFTGASNPFEELMDLPSISGKRVLEIGCGMGFHTEMMLRAGANLTSIDLSETSVKSTRRRLEVKGLAGDVRQMDAEQLEFEDNEFDMVWSWGVIHHSAHTGRILDQIRRSLKPGGDVRLMVYNLDGTQAYVTMMRRYLLGFWRGKSLDEQLWRDTDGFTARFYTRDQWRDLLSVFFDHSEIRAFGHDADALPLPRQLRRPLLKLIPVQRQMRMANSRGLMLFSKSQGPRQRAA